MKKIDGFNGGFHFIGKKHICAAAKRRCPECNNWKTKTKRKQSSFRVNSWLSLRLGRSRVYPFRIPNPFNPRNPRSKKFSRLKNFQELHPEFPGVGSDDKNHKPKK